MDPVQQAILALLKKQALGQQNAIKSDAIFAALASQKLKVFEGRTQEHIREAIRSMVNDFDELIGSGNTGFYMISSQDEVIDTIEDLKSRSKGNLERANRLKKVWNSKNQKNQI
jgi:hypothetical protein